jgi:hypothetical protein
VVLVAMEVVEVVEVVVVVGGGVVATWTNASPARRVAQMISIAAALEPRRTFFAM